MTSDAVADDFDHMWNELEAIGRHATTGGYRRFAWTQADLECRTWFTATAEARGMEVETDGNGNLWAWWGAPSADNAMVIGSHLDSVPDGGAFDGPLGVVSAFAAIEALRSRGMKSPRPIAVAAFSDEEGARFGVACGGSRLLTGVLDAERGLALRDSDGVTMADAMNAAAHDSTRVGADPDRLRRIGTFVELHIEQGRVPVVAPDGSTVRGLQGYGSPVAVASSIWPHGRWRFDLRGRADHAGTTSLVDRDDPMLCLAALVSAARTAAERADAVATIARVLVEPNGVNAIPALVRAWLDARGAEEERVRQVVAEVNQAAGDTASMIEESWTPETVFGADLRGRVVAALVPRFGEVPVLPTGAGHDAGILSAAGVPTAMLFVRNPTGVSHSPEEFAERADCHAGVHALTDVVEALL